jgi:hypothetical protein
MRFLESKTPSEVYSILPNSVLTRRGSEFALFSQKCYKQSCIKDAICPVSFLGSNLMSYTQTQVTASLPPNYNIGMTVEPMISPVYVRSCIQSNHFTQFTSHPSDPRCPLIVNPDPVCMAIAVIALNAPETRKCMEDKFQK